jgi:hypothetical protein
MISAKFRLFSGISARNGENYDSDSGFECPKWDENPEMTNQKNWRFAGKKRLKGFEPSTFCMASPLASWEGVAEHANLQRFCV